MQLAKDDSGEEGDAEDEEEGDDGTGGAPRDKRGGDRWSRIGLRSMDHQVRSSTYLILDREYFPMYQRC